MANGGFLRGVQGNKADPSWPMENLRPAVPNFRQNIVYAKPPVRKTIPVDGWTLEAGISWERVYDSCSKVLRKENENNKIHVYLEPLLEP